MTYADELNDMAHWPKIIKPVKRIQIDHMRRMSSGAFFRALQKAEDREWPGGYDYGKDRSAG